MELHVAKVISKYLNGSAASEVLLPVFLHCDSVLYGYSRVRIHRTRVCTVLITHDYNTVGRINGKQATTSTKSVDKINRGCD